MAIPKYCVIVAIIHQYRIKHFLNVIKSVCVPIAYVLVNWLHSATGHLPKSTSIFPLKCCSKNKDNKQAALREEICSDSTCQMTLTDAMTVYFGAQINVLVVLLSECKVR